MAGLDSIRPLGQMPPEESGIPDWSRQQQPDATGGNLPSMSPSPFVGGVQYLNRMSLELPWGAADEFRKRWDGDYSKAKQEYDAQKAMLAQYEAAVDPKIKYLRAAAGLLSPTKTGSFGESLGYGLSGYAQGAEEEVKAKREAEKMKMQLGLTTAHQGMQDALAMGDRDLKVMSTLSALERARAAMTKTPDLMQIHAWMNDPNITQDERLQRRRLVELRYGTHQIKNAGAINQGGIDSPEVARLTNTPLWQRAVAEATKFHPETAYQGADASVRNAAIERDALRIYNAQSSPQAAPSPQPGPQPSPQPAPQPSPQPAPQPGPQPAAPQAALMPQPSSYMDILTEGFKAPPPRQPGVIVDKVTQANLEAMMKGAEDAYQKSIAPGGDAGLKMKQNLSALRAINPTTGPIAPMVSSIAKWMDVLPESVRANSSIIREGDRIGSAEKLIESMRNDILLMAKGVQTEGDAQRAMKQIANISDPKARWDTMMSYMNAVADAQIDRQLFYGKHREKIGNYMGADTAWLQNAPRDLIKPIKHKDGTEKFVSYREFMQQATTNGMSIRDAWKKWNDHKWGE